MIQMGVLNGSFHGKYYIGMLFLFRLGKTSGGLVLGLTTGNFDIDVKVNT